MSTLPRLYKLDALRALSVLLVVVGHSYSGLAIGQLGVTIFFVISGYVITRLLIRERLNTSNFAIVPFFMRRILKIIPPLLAVIIIPSVILNQTLNLKLSAISSQIFFYFNFWSVDHWGNGYLRGSGVVWSLSIEEQFYVLVALLWLAVIRKNLKTEILGIAFGVAVLITIFCRYLIHNNNPAQMAFYTQNRMSAIALGGLVAVVLKEKSEFEFVLSNKVFQKVVNLLPLLIATLVILYCQLTFKPNEIASQLTESADTIRLANYYTLLDLAALFIVLSALNSKSWPTVATFIGKLRVIQVIGIASYSIYLVHHIVILTLIPKLNLPENSAVVVALRIILGILAGLVIHYLVDARFESARAKWRSKVSS